MAVADVFSKSVTTTALMSEPSACISALRTSLRASYFALAYAITLPTGEAHALAPDSVICTPSILSFCLASSARAWSFLLFERIKPFLMYLSSRGIRSCWFHCSIPDSIGAGTPGGRLSPL